MPSPSFEMSRHFSEKKSCWANTNIIIINKEKYMVMIFFSKKKKQKQKRTENAMQKKHFMNEFIILLNMVKH